MQILIRAMIVFSFKQSCCNCLYRSEVDAAAEQTTRQASAATANVDNSAFADLQLLDHNTFQLSAQMSTLTSLALLITTLIAAVVSRAVTSTHHPKTTEHEKIDVVYGDMGVCCESVIVGI